MIILASLALSLCLGAVQSEQSQTLPDQTEKPQPRHRKVAQTQKSRLASSSPKETESPAKVTEVASVATTTASLNLLPNNRTAKPASDSESEASQQAAPADDAGELSKKLANPVSSLISFPIQTNFDFGMMSRSRK